MNWAVWGPVFGTTGVALLGLVGLIYKARKDHHAALGQIEVLRKQANAATTQADAALIAANAAAATAQATAQAAVQNAFTEAYKAADQHWARYNEAMQKWNEDLAEKIQDNAKHIADAQLRIEEADERAHNWEKLYRKAAIYLRKLTLWIDQRLPGEGYPLPPPELEADL